MNGIELRKKYGIIITGNIATGKSFVAHILRELGFYVADADLLSRKAVEPGQPAAQLIREEFGQEVFLPDQTINRVLLRQVIFSDPTAKSTLESIVHPAIQDQLELALKERSLDLNPKTWFYEAAVIIEAGRSHEFKQVWMTHCPEEIQQKRLIKRDLLSEIDAKVAMNSQWDFAKKSKFASHIIDTNLPSYALRDSIISLLKKLKLG